MVEYRRIELREKIKEHMLALGILSRIDKKRSFLFVAVKEQIWTAPRQKLISSWFYQCKRPTFGEYPLCSSDGKSKIQDDIFTGVNRKCKQPIRKLLHSFVVIKNVDRSTPINRCVHRRQFCVQEDEVCFHDC